MGSLRNLVCNPKSNIKRREDTYPFIYELIGYCEYLSNLTFVSKSLMRVVSYSDVETHILNLKVTFISLIEDFPEEDDRTLQGYALVVGLMGKVKEYNESGSNYPIKLKVDTELKDGFFIKHIFVSGI
jgi:hypothetical protein